MWVRRRPSKSDLRSALTERDQNSELTANLRDNRQELVIQRPWNIRGFSTVRSSVSPQFLHDF